MSAVFCPFSGVAALNIDRKTIHKFYGFLTDSPIPKVKSDDYPQNQNLKGSM
jgi:hypothetical protein